MAESPSNKKNVEKITGVSAVGGISAILIALVEWLVPETSPELRKLLTLLSPFFAAGYGEVVRNTFGDPEERAARASVKRKLRDCRKLLKDPNISQERRADVQIIYDQASIFLADPNYLLTANESKPPRREPEPATMD